MAYGFAGIEVRQACPNQHYSTEALQAIQLRQRTYREFHNKARPVLPVIVFDIVAISPALKASLATGCVVAIIGHVRTT